MRTIGAVGFLVVSWGASPVPNIEWDIEAYRNTLRKRHPNWDPLKVTRVATEHVHMVLEETDRSRFGQGRGFDHLIPVSPRSGLAERSPVAAVNERSRIASASRQRQIERRYDEFPTVKSAIVYLLSDADNRELSTGALYKKLGHLVPLDGMSVDSVKSTIRRCRKELGIEIESVASATRKVMTADPLNRHRPNTELYPLIRGLLPKSRIVADSTIAHEIRNYRGDPNA